MAQKQGLGETKQGCKHNEAFVLRTHTHTKSSRERERERQNLIFALEMKDRTTPFDVFYKSKKEGQG
jgi:hypothetical protein